MALSFFSIWHSRFGAHTQPFDFVEIHGKILWVRISPLDFLYKFLLDCRFRTLGLSNRIVKNSKQLQTMKYVQFKIRQQNRRMIRISIKFNQFWHDFDLVWIKNLTKMSKMDKFHWKCYLFWQFLIKSDMSGTSSSIKIFYYNRNRISS